MLPDTKISPVSSNPFMKNDKDSGFKLNYAAYANSIRAKPLLKEASPACPVPIASDKQEKLRVLDILRTFDTQIKDEQVLFSNQHLNRSNTFTYRPSPKKSEPRASAINQKVETAASVSIKERLALLQSSPTKVSPTGQLAAGQSLSKLPDKLSQCVTSKVGIKQTQSLTGINPKHPTQTQKFKLEEEKTIEQIIAEHTKVDIMPVSERFKFFGALANKGSKPPLPASKSIFQPLKLQQLPVVLEVKASFSESNLGPDSTIIGTYKEAQTQSNLQIKQKDEIKTKDPNKMTISERRQYFQEKSAGISQVVPKISAPKKITRSEIIALSLPPIVEEPSKEMDSKRNDSGAFVEMEPICEEFLTGFNFDVEIGSMFDGSEFFADPAPKHKEAEIPKELHKQVDNQSIANLGAVATAEKFESQVPSFDADEKPVSLMNGSIETAVGEAPRSSRVSFGSAWDGSIAKTLTVPGSDWTYESPENSIGKILFKFTKIHSVTSGMGSLDKNIEIEVTQGSQSQCSPIYILHTWQTELAVEWEPNLFLVPDIPLQIVLRIKDMPVETQQTLKRSNTTKQAIENIFSSRGRKSEDDPRMIKSNDSVSSFSSICSMRFGNSTAPIKQKTTIANFNICTPVEWSADFKNNAEQHQIAVFASDWDHKRKGLFGLSKQPGIQKVAILDAQILFLPGRGSFQNEVLPSSITEYRDDLAIAQLHSKLWKEGYMYQLGGDCQTWTRRYFKLVGNDLIAHHPTSKEERSVIRLEKIEALNYNETDEQFSIEFKDFQEISFKPETCKNGNNNSWPIVIEESHHILATNQMPAWMV